MDKLKTAENDAKALSVILQTRYGFIVKLLLNANRADILDALNAYKNQLNPQDNLIIYFAGHGVKEGSAYWLPVDAKKDSSTQWIQAETLTTELKKINSDHILVISDSCYSGELSRGTSTSNHVIGERESYLKKLFGYKSRTLIASGGNEPVADSGRDNHSVFANALLDALENTPDDFYTDGELFEGYIKEKVAGSAALIPQYSYLKDSGHNDGSFIFVKHK